MGGPERSPEELWATGVTIATAVSALGTVLFYSIEDDGTLYYDDYGGMWWELAWVEGGRAVLCGRDIDFSETFDQEVDLLAETPDWLPLDWLRMRRRLGDCGFVYWCRTVEEPHWERTSYPGEDGDETAEEVSVPYDAARGVGSGQVEDEVEEILLDEAQSQGLRGETEAETEAEAVLRALTEVRRRVVERTVDAAVVEDLAHSLGIGGKADIARALATARRAGATPGAPRPELPAAPAS